MCIALIGSAGFCSKCLSLWTNLPLMYLPTNLTTYSSTIQLDSYRERTRSKQFCISINFISTIYVSQYTNASISSTFMSHVTKSFESVLASSDLLFSPLYVRAIFRAISNSCKRIRSEIILVMTSLKRKSV